LASSCASSVDVEVRRVARPSGPDSESTTSTEHPGVTDLLSGVTFDPSPLLTRGGFGETWTVKSMATVRLFGRAQLSAGVIARRGYDRPLFMAEAAGSDVVMAPGAPYALDLAQAPIAWDTELQLKVRAKKSTSTSWARGSTCSGPRVTAVYDRHSYDPEKRAALDFWAKRLDAIIANKPGGKLLVFAAAR
jgi:hypothetical protein